MHPLSRHLPSAALLASLGLSSCPRPTDPPPPPNACDAADAPNWHNFGEAYVTTWCAGCHSSNVTGELRQGAPVGLDFDRWSQVHAMRDRIAARATGEAPDMPPLGGTDPKDVVLLERWLACGAPGQDEPPDPCDVSLVPERSAGAAVVSTQAEADALCADANAADQLTIGGSVRIACLCSVSGDVEVSGGSAEMPLLQHIGGQLSMAGTSGLTADDLVSIGGSLSATGAVSALQLPSLQSIGGDLLLADLSVSPPSELSLDDLSSVGGRVEMVRTSGITRVDLPRLKGVGGDFIASEMADLAVLDGTRVIETIGGSLSIRAMPALLDLDDFAFMLLGSVGGDIRVEGNAALGGIHGFAVLPSVPGDVIIADNPSLDGVPGFDSVISIGGDLRIERNAAMRGLTGFVNLETVAGALILRDLPLAESAEGFEALTSTGGLGIISVGVSSWQWMPSLAAVEGTLDVEGCPNLSAIGGFDALVRVDRGIRLSSNPMLQSLDGWFGIERVGGAILASDNPALPAEIFRAWVDAIGRQNIGGAIGLK